MTKLLIRHAHTTNGHVGVEQVLSTLRLKYWVISGRAAVREEVGSCPQCRRLKAPLGNQLMGALRGEQLSVDEPPFTNTGLDLFGPLLIKQGRSTPKRYGCLFTCLMTRAVHLEVAHSLSTDSLLAAINRFVARRGVPKKIYSDQGTNMTAADKELRRDLGCMSNDDFTSALGRRRIEWVFNPPHSSHRGGLWERLIRSTRAILRSLIKQQLLTDEGLTTVLCEVERILNDRPITPVSSDHRDPAALRPADLLLLRGNPSVPLGHADQDCYTKRWFRQAQHIVDVFWRRWSKEYVPQLIARQKWHSKRRNMQVGDVVLIADQSLPRGKWPLGIVESVTPGRDGLVRSAVVQTSKSQLTRPVTQLALLEGALGDDHQ